MQDILLDRLGELSPDEAVAVRDQWRIADVAMACEGALARQANEVTVLACQWGPGYNAMFDGRALLWYENGVWQAQPYPEQVVRGVGYFRALRQDGDRLLVVMDVSRGLTRTNEQPHVLQRSEGWRVEWAPDQEAWDNTYTEIILEGTDIERFTAYRRTVDGDLVHRERWARHGDTWSLVDRADVSQEEAAGRP